MLVSSLPLLNFDSLGGGVAWNLRIWTIGGIFFRKNRKGKSVSFSRPEFVLICFHNLAPRHIKLCLPRSDHCINHGTNSSALDRRRVGAFEGMAQRSAEARAITALGDALGGQEGAAR